MKKLLEVKNEELAKLNTITLELFEFSNAFGVLGNTHMELELFEISTRIRKSINNIEQATTDDLDRQLKLTAQHTKTILETALAVGKMKTEGE